MKRSPSIHISLPSVCWWSRWNYGRHRCCRNWWTSSPSRISRKIPKNSPRWTTCCRCNHTGWKGCRISDWPICYNFVDNNGLDEADGLIVLFRKHVKDTKSIEKFNALCTKWEKLRSGNPSAASFSYPDINGKTVSLADLKGKYIYIDVWATWCGPCRGELPALKELEEKYAGKDIHFVSLSCDKNKKAWENMVTKDQLKGIQLHMGTDRTFMDAYLINGIPRFILLDRDGKSSLPIWPVRQIPRQQRSSMNC